MQSESDKSGRPVEYRRYFPDWTARSLRSGEAIEADHNSYFAGGYAEEFGCLAHDKFSGSAPLIAGKPADDGALRYVRRAGIHLGYPLKPSLTSFEPGEPARDACRSYRPDIDSGRDAIAMTNGMEFILVTQRVLDGEPSALTNKASATVRRWRAQLVAAGWEFPPLRH